VPHHAHPRHMPAVGFAVPQLTRNPHHPCMCRQFSTPGMPISRPETHTMRQIATVSPKIPRSGPKPAAPALPEPVVPSLPTVASSRRSSLSPCQSHTGVPPVSLMVPFSPLRVSNSLIVSCSMHVFRPLASERPDTCMRACSIQRTFWCYYREERLMDRCPVHNANWRGKSREG
jgi:hypothetical protein